MSIISPIYTLFSTLKLRNFTTIVKHKMIYDTKKCSEMQFYHGMIPKC